MSESEFGMPAQGPSGRERRMFDRWAVDGKARVMLHGKHDFECAIKDMSATGVAVSTDALPAVGDHAVIALDGFGILDAEVVRVGACEVALRFVVDDLRQQKIIDRLEERVVDGIESHLLAVVAALDSETPK